MKPRPVSFEIRRREVPGGAWPFAFDLYVDGKLVRSQLSPMTESEAEAIAIAHLSSSSSTTSIAAPASPREREYQAARARGNFTIKRQRGRPPKVNDSEPQEVDE